MERFNILIKYIPPLTDDEIGEWVFDKENDGSYEKPFQFPYVNYSDLVRNFVHDVYELREFNKDIGLSKYLEVLQKNNIEWGMESMQNADISDLDGQGILALIMGAIRAERFCDGTLYEFFHYGLILKWLKKLEELIKIDD